MNFFNELSNRWDQESPKFFKRLGAFGLTIGGIGAAILLTKADPTNTVVFPEVVYTIATNLSTAGALIKIVSSFTVKDPDYSTLDKK